MVGQPDILVQERSLQPSHTVQHKSDEQTIIISTNIDNVGQRALHMWDDTKQRRLDHLRLREQTGELSLDEQKILDQLIAELEEDEWATFQPVLSQHRETQQKFQADLQQLQEQNTALASLADRYVLLVERARRELSGLIKEQESLRAEYDRVLQS